MQTVKHPVIKGITRKLTDGTDIQPWLDAGWVQVGRKSTKKPDAEQANAGESA